MFLENVATKLGLELPSTAASAETFSALLMVLEQPVPEAVQWLGLPLERVSLRAQLAKRAQQHAVRHRELKTRLDTAFSNELFTLPAQEIWERFHGVYKSRLRWLRPRYWMDLSQLEQCSLKGRLSYRQAFAGLKRAAEVKEAEAWFRAHEGHLQECFGEMYQGAATNWVMICVSLEWTEQLLHILAKAPVPPNLVRYVKDSDHLKPMIQRARMELRFKNFDGSSS